MALTAPGPLTSAPLAPPLLRAAGLRGAAKGAEEGRSFTSQEAFGRLLPAATAGILVAGSRWRSRARRPARGGEEVLKPPLRQQDEWIKDLDLAAFGKEVHELGKRLKKGQNEEDNAHLRKMILWSKVCGAVGLATMWLPANPLTVFALSLWTHSAWTMIGHHVCHGGYNRCDKTGSFSSRGFALGSLRKRVADWFDWFLPEAWSVEHNNLHHFRLGEDGDPDLVERNVGAWNSFQKMIMPFISMLIWKWGYYAPNTYKELKVSQMRKRGEPLPEGFDPQAPLTLTALMQGQGHGVVKIRDVISKVIGPYFLIHFLLLPLPLALLGGGFYVNAVLNLLLADIVSNVHGFIVVVTNHAGKDLYRFQVPCKPFSPTFYLRAVISSANFRTGSNPVDFMHGWLNYQIEHHCWPDLSMLSYQKAQPELKAICEKYGVPYVQENVFVRLRKTLAIAMGRANMRVFPVEYERPQDAHVWIDEAKKVATA